MKVVTSLIGMAKALSLKGSGLFGDQSLDHQSLDLPSGVGIALPGIGVEECGGGLLDQPSKSVAQVVASGCCF